MSTYLDTLNINIVKKLKLYKLLGMYIHLYTGVPNKYRRRTIDRLKKYNLPFNRLYMRKNNDFRKDYIVKSEWLDLNNFKSINDKYGHIAGDKALQTLAKNLKELCRDTDNVMRTGGDEFLMVFTDLKSQEDFDKIIKKVEEKSKISMHFNTKTIEYSYSVGASVYPDNGNTIDEIINIADKKMYFNKKNRL